MMNTTQGAANASQAASPKPTRKTAIQAIIGGGIGNLMEQYDNLVYAYSATIVSQLFFPSEDPVVGLFATFATFAIGFLARPLGTLFFGHMGDKYGRKRALLLSVVMMGIATVAIGCLPTFEVIGVFAPALLVLLRLVQGFCAAGEWAGSAAMLVESAPSNRRGFFGSFNQVSTAAGFLLASAVVAVNTLIFSQQALLEFAWRLPFFFGALTLVVAVIMRLGMEDTPAFVAERKSGTIQQNPLVSALKTQFKEIARGFGFTVCWTVAYFFFLTYLPTYLSTVAGIDPKLANASNLTALAVLTVSIAVFGALSDRIGRKPLLIIGSLGFVLLSFPALALFNTGSVLTLFVGQIAIALVLASFSGPGPAALSELFPTNVRYSALGIGYNFSVMAFGGTAPFVATGIQNVTGIPIAVAALPTIAAIITFIVVLRMPESSKLPLR